MPAMQTKYSDGGTAPQVPPSGCAVWQDDPKAALDRAWPLVPAWAIVDGALVYLWGGQRHFTFGP